MLTKEEIMQIAKQIDAEANIITEYPKGYHFLRKEDMHSLSDPGFAVSKKDGKVFMGYSAHAFLQENLIEQ